MPVEWSSGWLPCQVLTPSHLSSVFVKMGLPCTGVHSLTLGQIMLMDCLMDLYHIEMLGES